MNPLQTLVSHADSSPAWAAADQRGSFPVKALPLKLRAFVEAAALASQAAVDLAAMACLGVCSAALAKRFRIEARPGCVQPVNLFVAAITSGLRREADLFQQAKQPLQTLEADQIELARIPRIQAQSLHRQATLRLSQREKQAAEDLQLRQPALDFATQVVANEVPPLPRLLIDDTTTEKLSTILAEQQGKIARFSTEAAARELLAGSTSQRSLAQQALYGKGYRGEDVTLDQRGGERTVVRQPAITCICALPQSSVAGLRQGRARRSRGVLDAFLFALPPHERGPRLAAPPSLTDEVRQQYEALIRSLTARQKEITLTLSREARERFQAWETEVETLLAADGPLASCAAWADHLPGNTLRIAAILHVIEHDNTNQVSAATIEAAITIARYFIPHALATFALLHQRDQPSKSAPATTAAPRNEPTNGILTFRSEANHTATAPPTTNGHSLAANAHFLPSKSQPTPAPPRDTYAANHHEPPKEQTTNPQPPDHPPNTRGSGPRRVNGRKATKQRAKR